MDKIKPSKVRVGEFYKLNKQEVQIIGMLLQEDVGLYQCFFVDPVSKKTVWEYDNHLTENRRCDHEFYHKLLAEFHQSSTELDFDNWVMDKLQRAHKQSNVMSKDLGQAFSKISDLEQRIKTLSL